MIECTECSVEFDSIEELDSDREFAVDELESECGYDEIDWESIAASHPGLCGSCLQMELLREVEEVETLIRELVDGIRGLALSERLETLQWLVIMV
jgi:hypothetical protein